MSNDTTRKLILSILENRSADLLETFEQKMNEKCELLIENRLQRISENLLVENDGDGGTDETDNEFNEEDDFDILNDLDFDFDEDTDETTNDTNEKAVDKLARLKYYAK